MTKTSGKKRVTLEDPLKAILEGKAITETVKTRRGDFVIKYPSPRDLREVELKIADMLRGKPAESFEKEKLANFRLYAALDVCIIEAPEWWYGLESAEDCPDDDLVLKLFGRYLRLYGKTQAALSKGKFRGSTKESGPGNTDETVDTGTFQGIADGQ